MQIGYAVTSRPTANKLNIHINNEAFFVDVFIGLANLMLDPLFGQLRSVDMQRNYWAGLNAALTAEGGAVSGNKKPQPQSWMSYPIGRFGFYLGAAVAKNKRQIRAELYLYGER